MVRIKGGIGGKQSYLSLGWYFIFSIALICLLASIPGYYARFVQPPLNQHFPTGIVLLSVASGLVSLASAVVSLFLALFIFIRRPGERMALFVSLFLLGYGIIMAGPLESLEFLFVGKTTGLSLYAQYFIFTTPTLALVLVFPTGKLVPARSRWILYLSLLSILAVPLMSYDELYNISSLRSVVFYFFLITLALFAFACQLYRYFRKSTPIERQQTKVVVYGFGVWIFFILLSTPLYFILINFPDTVIQQAWQESFGIFWQIGVAMIPVSLAMAIIRSHLWDIDIIIRKTLIYALLTATLGLVYFGSILLLQGVFTAIGLTRSPVVIVLSTLAIIVLVAPLRRRIQDFIDRRFYRKRYDAQQTLAVFSAELREKIDLDQLSHRVLDVVQETVQPESVTIWLVVPPEKRSP